jgi:hypothetical protein
MPLDLLMRLRFNPFFGYVERRIIESIELAEASAPALDH